MKTYKIIGKTTELNLIKSIIEDDKLNKMTTEKHKFSSIRKAVGSSNTIEYKDSLYFKGVYQGEGRDNILHCNKASIEIDKKVTVLTLVEFPPLEEIKTNIFKIN